MSTFNESGATWKGDKLLMENEKQMLDEGLLWQSAEHWLENWRDPEHASIVADKCACCHEYYYKSCQGCPISEHTGQSHCYGTPYYTSCATLSFYRFGSGSVQEFQEQAERVYVLLVELALSCSSKSTVNKWRQ